MKIWVKGYLGVKAALGDKLFVEFGADRVTLQDLLLQLGYQRDESCAAPGAVGRFVILLNGRSLAIALSPGPRSYIAISRPKKPTKAMYSNVPQRLLTYNEMAL